MRRISAALVGFGKFGKNYWRLLQETPPFELDSIVTRSGDPSLPGVFHSNNFDEVLKNRVIDCAIIATPPATHFELTKKALEAGKHVLVEKPMVLSAEEARELASLAKERGRICMVGYQYIYNDAIAFIKKFIEDNPLDPPLLMESEHYLSPPREDTNCFWDAAPHPLSVFQFLFNPSAIVSVTGTSKKRPGEAFEDFITATIIFDTGPKLSIATSWLGEKKVRKFSLSHAHARIVLDETLPSDNLTIISNRSPMPVPQFKSEPLKNELAHFAKCIESGSIPRTSAEFGCVITEWLEKISNSIQNAH
jgi:UDP-2-acetamido-3-amino-2,3-dideoxy-glucuronate N-acetyltransferase